MSSQDEVSQENISWNDSLEDMIGAEGEKCGGLAWLYTESERYYSKMNTYIALPVIVLSTVTGFLSGSSQILFRDPAISSIGIGGVSLFTGVLSTIGSYFAWAKKTEACRISALQYRKLQKFIITEMTLPKVERIRARDMLKMIRETVERLLETSPAVPEHIIKIYNSQFKSTSEISHPEMTQGIEKVRINRVACDIELHKVTKIEKDKGGNDTVRVTMAI
jgi:hypothetical protein